MSQFHAWDNKGRSIYGMPGLWQKGQPQLWGGTQLGMIAVIDEMTEDRIPVAQQTPQDRSILKYIIMTQELNTNCWMLSDTAKNKPK